MRKAIRYSWYATQNRLKWISHHLELDQSRGISFIIHRAVDREERLEMSNWQTDYVEANGIRLHYYRTGGSKPPVVLAHGISDDGLCWSPVAEALAEDYDVVMVDARGHGKSDAPEQGYGLSALAEDLADVIGQLELDRPAILGHSMGGATTLVLAGTHTDIPRAILIEDAGALNLTATTQTQEERRRPSPLFDWIASVKRKTRDELLEEQRTQTPRWSEAELAPWADAKHRLSLNILNRANSEPVDWEAILPRITCPALLITADPELGAIVNDQQASELQARVPQLRVAHIPDAGHNIRRDQFGRYLEIVREFLREVM